MNWLNNLKNIWNILPPDLKNAIILIGKESAASVLAAVKRQADNTALPPDWVWIKNFLDNAVPYLIQELGVQPLGPDDWKTVGK